MKTAVICFEGGNDYIKKRQISKILREENERFGISCKNYDELDKIIPVLKEKGVNKLIILHEDKNIDRFERAAHIEFNQLFEKVEIGIDYSKEKRLYEADKKYFDQGTVETVENKLALKIAIFPINAPVLGANSLVSSVTSICNSISLPTSNVELINVSTLDCASTGFWSSGAVNLCYLLQNGKSLKDAKYAFARTFNGLNRVSLQTNKREIRVVYGPPALLDSFGVPANKRGMSSKIIFNDETFTKTLQDNSIKAYKTGLDILNAKNTKIDKERFKTWQQKQPKKLLFLNKALEDILYTSSLKNNDVVEKNGKSFIDNSLNKLGFYNDVATFSQMGKEAGLDLLITGASLLLDAAKDKDEKIQSKTAPFVSHSQFDEFASYFDDESVIIEAQK